MRKVLVALAAAAVAAVVAAEGATPASADNGADWLVAGTGTIVCCNQPMVHVNAQSGVGGANPRGHFWIRYPNGGPDFGGHVTCMNVGVNTAAIVGRIDMVKSTGMVGAVALGNPVNIRVTDNGSPGTLDMVNFDFSATCSGVGDLAISQGNYVVHNQPVNDLLSLDQFLAQIETAADDPYG